MAELPAMYHMAYSLAVAQWDTMQLGGHPSDEQLAALRHFVRIHLAADYPGVPAAQLASATDYGVTSAERDLTSPDQGGFIGTVGGAVGDVVDTIEGGVSAVETAARASLGSIEAVIKGLLAKILAAVPLPRSALPAKVPTQLTQSYATVARQVGTLTPTALAHTATTRTRIRRLGR